MPAPFTDISIYTAEERDAIEWGYEHGITKGISSDKFGPDLAVTRTQMLMFLHRFATTFGLEATDG
jgi:hypothetical protein